MQARQESMLLNLTPQLRDNIFFAGTQVGEDDDPKAEAAFGDECG
jgi:hypothetical protein